MGSDVVVLLEPCINYDLRLPVGLEPDPLR
jgi:hypothetical protein